MMKWNLDTDTAGSDVRIRALEIWLHESLCAAFDMALQEPLSDELWTMLKTVKNAACPQHSSTD